MSDNIFKISKTNDLFQLLRDLNNKLIIIMFSAKWCGPCKSIKNNFYEFSKIYTNSLFIYIDIDEYNDKDCPIINKVDSVPTFMFFNNNNLLTLIKGANSNKLQETIKNCELKVVEQNIPKINMLIITQEKKLLEVLNNNNDVLIMISANWCGPCKTIKPEFNNLSKKYQNKFFVYIDIDNFDEKECPIIDKVKSLPTFMYFSKNKLVDSFEGADLERLNNMVNEKYTYT